MSYKVWILNAEGTIENIIIFEGRETEKEKEKKKDSKIFSGEYNDITIKSPVAIHKDDSILQIKKKILNELGRDSQVSYHELYLFAYVNKLVNIYSAFIESTTKKSNYLDKTRFTQFVRSLSGPKSKLYKVENENNSKTVFTYEDVAEKFKQSSAEMPIAIPLGLQIVGKPNYFFAANPFEAVEFSPKNLGQTEYSLLMNHGEIIDNNIYVCLAGDVFNANPENSAYFSKTYYPYLASKSIFGVEELTDKKSQLMAETVSYMDPRIFKLYETIDMFYDIYSAGGASLNYLEKGLRKYKIAIYPSSPFIMPLEPLFKNIHATEKYKFIKLNLGVRRENVYRIYSNKLSTTGRKIPEMPRALINSLAKNIGRHKQISIYIDSSKITVNVESNGTIIVSGEFKTGTSPNVLEDLIKAEVNPLLEEINGYLQNSGYRVSLMTSLYAPNIGILSMDYISAVSIKREVSLKNITGCLYALFDVLEADVVKGAELRFKRVENYREMDQQTVLITEVFKRTGREEDVIDALVKYHDMTPAEALKRITQYIKEATYENVGTGHDGKTIGTVDNPGLPLRIRVDPANSSLVFTVDEIIHLGYLDTLEIYIDSMIRILQEIPIPGMSKAIINEKCSKVTNVEEKGVKRMNEIVNENEEIEVKDEVEVKPSRAFAFNFEDEEEEEEPKEAEKAEEIQANPYVNELLDKTKISSDDDFVGIEQMPENSSGSDFSMTGLDIEGGGSSSSDEADSNSDNDDYNSDSNSDSETNHYNQTNKANNPFLQKLQKLDPAVFLQSEKGRTNVYARTCQSIRQPVILTAEEKARIDKKSPGSYTKAMKFGSTPDKEHYYICPRFWCSKTNTSMTEEQVKAGECDPEYLHEFKNPNNPIEHINEKGEYIDHYPGFVKNPKLKHCMPCCFASQWDSWKKDKMGAWAKNKQLKSDKNGNVYRRKGKEQWKLVENMKADEMGVYWTRENASSPWTRVEKDAERPRFIEKCEANAEEGQAAANTGAVAFIFNPEKREITPGRWGYVPYSAQHFMQIKYDNVFKQNNAALLRDDAITYLRYGVEYSETNSLLCVLADLYAAEHNIKPVPTVRDGKFGAILAKSVSLDQFAKYGNASFTALFKPDKIEIGEDTIVYDENNGIWNAQKSNKITAVTINPDLYSDSALYKMLKSSDESIQESAWETMAAYEAYKAYLQTTKSTIDFTFIWDLITNPNPALYSKGLNLVIMDVLNNDITDNIEIMCPTNTYSKTKFDIDRPTAFLIKQEMLMYPIYLFNADNKKITRTFTKTTEVPNKKTMGKILKMLNHTLNNYCKARGSMPNVYKYEQPVPAHIVESVLKELTSYRIIAQAVNYQGKTIALQVQNGETRNTVYVPCQPAAQLDVYESKLMDDTSLWAPYETTRNELILLSDKLPQLKCRPMLKVVEDKLVVGLLTQTNQLVPVSNPDSNMKEDGIPVFRSYIKSAETATGIDVERETLVRNIKIESDYYNLFRATIKTLLEKPDNYKFRDYLIKIVNEQKNKNNTNVYRTNLKNVAQALLNLTYKTVEFIDFDEAVIKSLYTQMGKPVYICGKGKMSGILKDACKLLLPLHNLIVPTRDNRLMYFYRVADELMRYGRLRNYVLNPTQYLNTGSTEYSVNRDEFIVLETSLLDEYYDMQQPMIVNGVVSGEIPFENARVENEQKYPNVITLEEQNQITNENTAVDLLQNCVKKIDDIKGNKDLVYWKRVIFKNTEPEITYKADVECSFGPLLKIMTEVKKRKHNDIDELRNLIWSCYRDIVRNPIYLKKVVKILGTYQGKSALVKGVDSIEKFATMILNQNYFLTSLDLYVVARREKIPIILFANEPTLEDMNTEANWMIIGLKTEGKSGGTKFYFVRAQRRTVEQRINENSMLERPFNINELGEMKESIQNTIVEGKVQTVQQYLDSMEL